MVRRYKVDKDTDAEEKAEDKDKEAFEEGVAALVAVKEAEKGCCRVQKWSSWRENRVGRRLPTRRRK